MSDFIKKFKNIWEYRNAYSGLPQPNIVYVENNNIVDFNPEDRIIAKIRVLNNFNNYPITSHPQYFSEIEIDGVKYNNPDSVSAFNFTAGEHIVKYKYNTDLVLTYGVFGAQTFTYAIIVPEGIKEINLSMLPTPCTNYSFPESTERLTGYFNDESYIESLTCKAKTPPEANNLGAARITDIYVPTESVNAYKAANGWSSHSNNIKSITP